MKRLFLLMAMVVVMATTIAATINVKSGLYNPFSSTNNFYSCCTLVGTDTITGQDLNFYTEYHTGWYEIWYRVDSVRDPVKVKFIYEESLHKDSTGYYNAVTFDSCVTAETTLARFDNYIHGGSWGRFTALSWMSANDTVIFQMLLKPVQK